ncbi:zinc finger protein CONSTANS-LIKE 2 [Corylus avellana]|uniref:zinc finger protein CONSTANS-LIKE 2 n=1 Tax=Corylus avellana TaxID=13451 RepID=UPI001E20DFBB|nr:zinc finger protein CONSTANS-LIKE 2 [Corylus avellana]
MSSDLFLFDHDPFYRHSTSDMVSSDGDLTFIPDSPLDIFQAISDSQNQQNPVDESHSFDHYSSTLLSSSPSHQFESLNLYQTTHLQWLQNGSDFDNGLGNMSGLEGLEVKNEECQMGFESSFNHQAFLPHSYSGGGGAENVAKLMQRSYSSNSFDAKTGFLFQPRFDTLMESPSFQNQEIFGGQMRRVCSTGDLQTTKAPHATQRSFSSSLAVESSFIEETNFKVGRYSAEERKERISKYRAKRNQRNFNKTIKYACRKTLADNRPRIRGRFARNDEPGDTPKAACSTSVEDEDDLWLEGLHEENGTVRIGEFVNTFGATQLQYYGF